MKARLFGIAYALAIAAAAVFLAGRATGRDFQVLVMRWRDAPRVTACVGYPDDAVASWICLDSPAFD